MKIKGKMRLVAAAFLAVFSLMGTMFLANEVKAENALTSDICKDSAYSAEQKAAAGCNENRTARGVATGLINVVLAIVGLIAVVMIILGGVQYAISSGDAGKVATAKNIILYGVIGLVVALLAYAVVNFVMAGVLSGSTGPVATGGSSSEEITGSGDSSSSVADEDEDDKSDGKEPSVTDRLKALCSEWGGVWKAKDASLPKRCVNLPKKRQEVCENNSVKNGTFVKIQNGQYEGKYRCQWGKAASGGGFSPEGETSGGGGSSSGSKSNAAGGGGTVDSSSSGGGGR